ncbi:hypothetical protein SAMN06265365_14211 [Tistlia consotensis]|uniref:Uncharacterized protein n=1 Tax=Tistlia consotensis USBA 355 TaxID=560819 RepID=A0A1Y6CWH3_9PROT|nr:hypothetical protein [Tistlia consotensis]SMF82006.1 hypothetical protein SAMN05428998_14511 [Tistlia consotensis USBA 355]SNS25071.1 hypothetical protein SAMN06265365_14211 [Tistlia consotensis]
MSLLAIALQACGLSQREAAEYLAVRLDTLKSWSAGRKPTRPGILSELRALAGRQEAAAESCLLAWERDGRPAELCYALAGDDEAARRMGWPCVGAQRAVARRLWERLPQGIALRITAGPPAG